MQQENMVFCPAKPKGNLNHPSFFYLLSDRDACARTSERLAQLPLVPPASTEKRSTKPARNHSTQTQHPPPMCMTISHFTSPRLELVLSCDTPKPPAPAPSFSIRSFQNKSVLSSSFGNSLHTPPSCSPSVTKSCELWTKANTGASAGRPCLPCLSWWPFALHRGLDRAGGMRPNQVPCAFLLI